MVPLAAYEWPERADSSKVRVLYGTIEWAESIFERLNETSLKVHLHWPKRVAEIVVSELEGTAVDGPSVLRLDLPLSNIIDRDGSTSTDSPLPGGFWDEPIDKLT
jgi:hypothetical protein